MSSPPHCHRRSESRPRRSGLARAIVPSVVLGAVVLFVLAIVADGSEMLAALRSFRPEYLAAALALASGNYVIRFVRWHVYLRTLAVDVPARTSAGVFFSGLSMAITPGKLGELLKCVMLRDRAGAPVSLTAPAVIAERFTDLAAVLLLVSLGILSYPSVRPLFIAGVVAVAVVFVALTLSPALVDRLGAALSRSLLKGRDIQWAAESSQAFRTLLAGRVLVAGLVLGVAAWFAECVAFWLIVHGLGLELTLFQATLAYAVATLAGALSMLPGGLGVTEASMTGLLVTMGLTLTGASASTLIIRACTLWWGVFVGLAFYAAHAAEARRALAELAAAEEGST